MLVRGERTIDFAIASSERIAKAKGLEGKYNSIAYVVDTKDPTAIKKN